MLHGTAQGGAPSLATTGGARGSTPLACRELRRSRFMCRRCHLACLGPHRERKNPSDVQSLEVLPFSCLLKGLGVQWCVGPGGGWDANQPTLFLLTRLCLHLKRIRGSVPPYWLGEPTFVLDALRGGEVIIRRRDNLVMH
jgi:hypothetical protein